MFWGGVSTNTSHICVCSTCYPVSHLGHHAGCKCSSHVKDWKYSWLFGAELQWLKDRKTSDEAYLKMKDCPTCSLKNGGCGYRLGPAK